MSSESLKSLFEEREGFKTYNAGLPQFPRNFTRDAILSSLLFGDMEMLKSQLEFSAKYQGKVANRYTGEESGKMFHEFPEYIHDGMSTLYNACDTTALFLIGLSIYKEKTQDTQLVDTLKKVVTEAVLYLKNHIKDGFFIESPSFCGAEKFSLKVTYWKDSCLARREKGNPAYPIVYTLAHLQALAGIRAAYKLTSDTTLLKLSEVMISKLPDLIDPETGSFYIALDELGAIQGITSDNVHALYYLEPGDLSEAYINRLIDASKALITDAGYRTMESSLAAFIEDKYHTTTVWPFEQGFIHSGAKKFGLHDVAEIAARVVNFLDSDPEILNIGENEVLTKGGCDPQLWTIAVKEYFRKNR
jgi:glycogen debranching enzyme